MEFQIAYRATARPTIDCGESLTEQSHKNECDMNLILRDYARTGFMRHARENEGRYDDVSPMDFQEAMIVVAETKSLFEGLPSEVRKQFGNEPKAFLEYVQNPANASQLEKMGVLRGNDGIDISGAYTTAPTMESVSASADTVSSSEPASDSASSEPQ